MIDPSIYFTRHIANIDRQEQVNMVHRVVEKYAIRHPNFTMGQLLDAMDVYERVAINVAIHTTTRMSGIHVDPDAVTAFLLGHPVVEPKSKPPTLFAGAAYTEAVLT